MEQKYTSKHIETETANKSTMQIIGNLATSIRENTDWFEQCILESYVHQNGFHKIVIGTIDGAKLRFHIYRPGDRADENIHNHRWDFSSTILQGVLPMTIFDITDGDEYILHQYKKVDEQAHVDILGRCGADHISTYAFKPKDIYYLPHNVFHRIDAVERLTITFMVCEPAHSETCELVSTEDRTDPNEIRGAHLTPQELREDLHLIEEATKVYTGVE